MADSEMCGFRFLEENVFVNNEIAREVSVVTFSSDLHKGKGEGTYHASHMLITATGYKKLYK